MWRNLWRNLWRPPSRTVALREWPTEPRGQPAEGGPSTSATMRVGTLNGWQAVNMARAACAQMQVSVPWCFRVLAQCFGKRVDVVRDQMFADPTAGTLGHRSIQHFGGETLMDSTAEWVGHMCYCIGERWWR